MVDAALRTDGNARACLISSMQKGIGGNQKATVEKSQKPIAIVAGSQDAGINTDYIQKEVSTQTLWKRKVHLIEGGHAVFWQNPKKFNTVLSSFLNDVNRFTISQRSPKKINAKLLVGCAALMTLFFVVVSIFNWRNSASNPGVFPNIKSEI